MGGACKIKVFLKGFYTMHSWVKSLLLLLGNSSFKRRIVWTLMLDILFTLNIYICISKFYLSSQTTFYYSISRTVKAYSIFFLDQLCFNKSLSEGVWNQHTWFKKYLPFSFFLLSITLGSFVLSLSLAKHKRGLEWGDCVVARVTLRTSYCTYGSANGSS